MPGPPPKDPKLRQRRNRASTRARLTRTRERRTYAPRLPKREGKGWHPLTRDWWRDVWHSPMVEEFLEVDRHALLRLATLIDMFWTGPTKELAAEIRLEQQAFGLTPIDRRRLQWTVESEEVRTRTRQVAPAEDEVDPRKLLKVASK